MWHSLLSYHPRIGYTYTPSVKSRVPFETGGYLVRTNSDGFRSEHEFVKERVPGKFRAILFGDSMTAGDGVANMHRFSDLIEKTVPDLQIYNYGLSGVGTDQQYLAYLECVGQVEHDLLIICVTIDQINRSNSRVLTFRDAQGRDVYYAKPYYEIENDELVLHNVPVPKRPWTKETLPEEETAHVDSGRRIFPKAQALLRPLVNNQSFRSFAANVGMRDLLRPFAKVNGIPDYDSPDNPGWLKLRKILANWIQVSQVPVLIIPLPMWTQVEGASEPTPYQIRFRELASDTGCVLHDPLVDLLAHTAEERRAFRFKLDLHLSPNGHQAMAQSIAFALQQIVRQTDQPLPR